MFINVREMTIQSENNFFVCVQKIEIKLITIVDIQNETKIKFIFFYQAEYTNNFQFYLILTFTSI